ncbi:hypothetical protein Q765_05900 [Flavobacterium rivuli WB 3.3-2 = DSM 21788]|uniref:Lipoprotein n=1 Tax=Flavobacterium rivuli WB 3.3-2 = DSM 21788 TaxID=1121895 RepID=A0A0A2M4X7_9FLAO|nr:DUF5074 domain-containing protein [Flavobacterium rivuli]KGO87662.1 hypothetical protein Q765_05900 [Flavobacterium rivuli WB 3.3-2 = DSM 21788]
MKLNKLLFTVLAGSLFFVSCSSDDDNTTTPSGAYANGVIVLNQGNFTSGNASVSFISNAFAVENNIFDANLLGQPLGDTGQDIGLNGDFAYIVVNNSHKVEIVNRYTFAPIASLQTGLTNPRYITFENGKGYVTCWGVGEIAADDYIAVIDLATNTLTSTRIPVAEGPEKIIAENGKLYVAHKGGYGMGTTISVINTTTNTVETTIEVGAIPGSLEAEDGTLYVLSEGYPYYASTETAGRLTRINLSNNRVVATTDFPNITHPSNLVIEDNAMYYTIGTAVYKTDLLNTTLPITPLFNTSAQSVTGITAFDVEDDHIYVGSGSYTAAGKVNIYSLTGAPQQSLTVGIAPAGFYFNN